MNDLFLKIKEQLAAQLPFAVYAKPNSNTVTGIFQKYNGQHKADYTAKGFVFAPFEGEAVFIPAGNAEVITSEIEGFGFKKLQPKSFDIDKDAKADFEALVAKSVDAINNSSYKKLVTSRRETVEVPAVDSIEVYKKLLDTYPAAFRYCFYSEQSGLWMGATPEQLLKLENNTLHTVALAGTQLYKDDEEAVWEAKEQQEQQFVTNYILEELQVHATNVTTTPPYTFRAGTIVHIKTDISATLNNAESLQDIINTLHPTPAICGLPKANAKAFLLENEGYNREYYSGYLGEVNHDFETGQPKTDLFVNLRCMKIGQESAQLYIGCGITKDSNPEKEFFETVNKSMTMRRVL
jgi:isochorismate synthase